MSKSIRFMLCAAFGMLVATGFTSLPAQAHCQVHAGASGHCWSADHKHHNGGHRKYLHDDDYNYHPEYGWGYYNVPSSYFVRAHHHHHGTRHCHIKKRWRHGHFVRIKTCHRSGS